MKKLILLLALLLTAPAALAQKMVIGSKIPDLKGVQWHTSVPANGKPMLIEFYNPDNSSSARFFPKLEEIKSRYGDRVVIVVIGQSGSSLASLVSSHGTRYHFCTDTDGKLYNSFNVRFLPYTVLVSSKGELHWQGNLGNITDDALQKVQ